MDDNEMESAVLTRMSSQLDKLDGDMQNVRDRMTRLELQVGYMNDKLVRLDIQMSHGTPLPRAVIAAGSVALGFVLIMLSFVVWKLI